MEITRLAPLEEKPMCPLCVATGTIALVSAGSAGSIGAIAAKVLHAMRKQGADGGADPTQSLSGPTPEERPQRQAVRVAYIGGDPFNACSTGL
jgi:hypothetical protein